MATISTQLRNFKEPTKEQLNLLFFSLPVDAETHGGQKAADNELEKMEISAVLSLGQQGVEEAYVSLRGGSPHVRFTKILDLRSQGRCTSSHHTWRSRHWIANRCGSQCRCVRYGEWNG